MDEVAHEFTYILGEKEDLLLVLFQGKFSHEAEPVLEKLDLEIQDKPQSIVLFVFRDVSGFMPGPHVNFAKTQKAIRDAGKLVGICSLKPEVRNILLKRGVVRESEIFNNIPDAWKSLRFKLESQKP